MYWCLREYSRAHEGLVAVIIDSYDKAKLSLPRWPFSRTPKKSLYEETRRSLANPVFFRSLLCTFWVCLSYNLSSFFQHSNATEELIWHSQLWFVMDGGAFCIWAVKHWQRDPTGTGNVFLDWIVLDSLPSSSFINVFWFLILPQSRWCDRWMKFLQVQQHKGNHFPTSNLTGLAVLCSPAVFFSSTWERVDGNNQSILDWPLVDRFHLQADNTVKDLWLGVNYILFSTGLMFMWRLQFGTASIIMSYNVCDTHPRRSEMETAVDSVRFSPKPALFPLQPMGTWWLVTPMKM